MRTFASLLTHPGCGGSVARVGETLYDDETLVVDDQGLTLRRYYFPMGRPKRIRYRDVRRVDVRPMSWLTGKGRGWGTADPRYWLPLDFHRAGKRTLLCFDLGRHVKPCVSPRDPDRVIELLRSRVPMEGSAD